MMHLDMQMANLLLVLSHADTAVKGRLCEFDTLKTLFTAIENSSEALQLTVLKAIKQLTSDPSMLEALEVRQKQVKAAVQQSEYAPSCFR